MVSGFRVVTKKCGQYIHVLALAEQCLHGGRACCLWLCPTPQWQDWVCQKKLPGGKPEPSQATPCHIKSLQKKRKWTVVECSASILIRERLGNGLPGDTGDCLCITSLSHRIIRVEKHLNPTVIPLAAPPSSPSSHVLKCHSHVFLTLGGRVTPPLLWAVHSNALHPFCEEFFPDV